jgi:hypothetical protein
MLSRKNLNNISPGVFTNGSTWIKHPHIKLRDNYPGALLCADKEGDILVRWVAIKLSDGKWCIKHSLSPQLEKSRFLDGYEHYKSSDEDIMTLGTLLTNKDKIRSLVPAEPATMVEYLF